MQLCFCHILMFIRLIIKRYFYYLGFCVSIMYVYMFKVQVKKEEGYGEG